MKKKNFSQKSAIRIISNVVIAIAMVFCLLLIVLNTCYGNIVVSGASMSPTLQDLEYGIMNTTGLKKKSIKRFEIIIFEARVGSSDTSVIKRVIGLPGETIHIDGLTGELYVNAKLVEQKFLKSRKDLLQATCNNTENMACNKDFLVPEKEYYVLGDNRISSYDSEHGIGTIPQDKIHGVLFAIQGTCQEIVNDSKGNEVCSGKKSSSWRFY